MQHHLLNWGMGVESTAILLRWIYDPSSRPFKHWHELIVLVAQTGDEFWETKLICETHILPLLRKHGVRLVQVAKAGQVKKDGYAILSDTTEPYELHIWDERIYSLGFSFTQDAWTQRLNRPHICAQRWKGEVLDAWIGDNIVGGFGPYLGYNAEETKRMNAVADYGCHGERYIFPLIEWGWTRDDCIEYIYRILGAKWRKSCCQFCPFQTKANAIAHYTADCKAAAYALWCEYVAMSMNPRMLLFERHGMRDICNEAGLDDAIAAFEQKASESEYSLYQVRRIYRKTGSGGRIDSARKVEAIETGSRAAMTSALQSMGGITIDPYSGLHYFYTHVREEKVYPAIEGFYVASPSCVRDKCHRKNFEADWRKLVLGLKLDTKRKRVTVLETSWGGPYVVIPDNED